jgi:nitroreductase
MEAAPSAGNLQPWGFYVVTRQELKDTLCTLSFDQQAVAQAGALFVITAKPALSAEKYDELGKTLFCLQDTACAAQNLLLAAHELGYGAVWIGVVKSREISEALDLPAAETPVALVPVGIPAEEPGNYERTPWQEKTTFLD